MKIDHQSKSENKKWVSCQKESQATISESSLVQGSLIQQKAHLCLRQCNLDNTMNRRIQCARKFYIKEKTKPVYFRGQSHIKLSHSLPQIDTSGQGFLNSGKGWEL